MRLCRSLHPLLATAAVLLCVLAAPAYAVPGAVWWSRVTHYADGGQLGTSDPVTYVVEFSDNNAGEWAPLRTTTAASISVDHPEGVLRCYRNRAVVPDVEGTPIASDPSNEWCMDLRTAPPVEPEPDPAIGRAPAAPTGFGGR
jgi:hypothetical protein